VRTGTLRAILKQADIATDEFLKLLKKENREKIRQTLHIPKRKQKFKTP